MSQNRSTFMMAVDGPQAHRPGRAAAGQSAFISLAGAPSPPFCSQAGLFNDFRHKNMPSA